MTHKLSYSISEAAQLLGIGRSHLYKFIDSGQLLSFKLGQRRLINHEALDDFRLTLQRKHTEAVGGGS